MTHRCKTHKPTGATVQRPMQIMARLYRLATNCAFALHGSVFFSHGHPHAHSVQAEDGFQAQSEISPRPPRFSLTRTEKFKNRGSTRQHNRMIRNHSVYVESSHMEAADV